MSTVNYNGADLSFFDSQTAADYITWNAANIGGRYHNLPLVDLQASADHKFLAGSLGLDYRSSKHANLQFFNPYANVSTRLVDGIAWPTGVQRFGNS